MRIKTIPIAVLAALCLFQVVLADDKDKNDDGGDDDEQTTEVPAASTTPLPDFDVEIDRAGINVNEITIVWESPSAYNDEVDHYYLTATKIGSENVLTSPDLDSDVREYRIADLVHESDYQVCLYAVMKNGTTIPDCSPTEVDPKDPNSEVYHTLAFIRDSSLVVLFCVLGYILLMILLGYICWSYAKKKAEAEYEEEEEEEEEEKGGRALLGNNRPGSAGIDDSDIPFITPPLSELQKDTRSKPSVEV